MKGKREALHKGAEDQAFTVTSVAVQLLKSQTLPKHTTLLSLLVYRAASSPSDMTSLLSECSGCWYWLIAREENSVQFIKLWEHVIYVQITGLTSQKGRTTGAPYTFVHPKSQLKMSAMVVLCGKRTWKWWFRERFKFIVQTFTANTTSTRRGTF